MFMRDNYIRPALQDLKNRIDANYPFKDIGFNALVNFLRKNTVDELYFQLDKHALDEEVERQYYDFAEIIQDLVK